MERIEVSDLLTKVAWASLPQPGSNAPDEAPKALLAVANAADKQSAERAYHKLLYAAGNNHDGSYYPIVLFMLPVLERIIRDQANWPAFAALNALIDLYCSFSPHSGYEAFVDSSGAVKEVEPALRSAVLRLRPLLEEIVADTETGVERRAAAQELLETISGP